MKKQVVLINGNYYARYKKWYNLRWRYIGNIHSWYFINEYCRCESIDEAKDKLYKYFNTEIIIIN